jgi:uncharacterized membrane protein YraQ (UPF0718 family)
MLEELQSLNEITKKRVLVITTIIIMIIIVGIWISYLNGIVAGPAEQAAAQANANAAASAAPIAASAPVKANGPSMWQEVEHWFGSIPDSIANIFQKPSQYTIQPSGN